MTTNINADTLVGGAVITGDASGVLALQAAGNTAITINSSRAIGVGASPSFGNSGQVLTSAGSAAAPTWQDVGTIAPTTIGQSFAGGFYAGQIGASDLAVYYLVVAPLSTGQFSGPYKTSGSATFGTSANADGPTNTNAMIAAGAAAHPCAQFCNNLVTGGYSDWYMPSRYELELCYYNLKPTTQTNNSTDAASGTNPNAIPARATAYTASIPAQTSAAAFQFGGAQAFSDIGYWSSTQNASFPSYAFAKEFKYGYSANSGYSKTITRLVRAMRRVSI